MKRCVFAGTFDPPTSGHKSVVEACLKIFDEVVAAVMVNTRKTPLLSEEQRKKLLEKLFSGNPRVKVEQKAHARACGDIYPVRPGQTAGELYARKKFSQIQKGYVRLRA